MLKKLRFICFLSCAQLYIPINCGGWHSGSCREDYMNPSQARDRARELRFTRWLSGIIPQNSAAFDRLPQIQHQEFHRRLPVRRRLFLDTNFDSLVIPRRRRVVSPVRQIEQGFFVDMRFLEDNEVQNRDVQQGIIPARQPLMVNREDEFVTPPHQIRQAIPALLPIRRFMPIGENNNNDRSPAASVTPPFTPPDSPFYSASSDDEE